MRNAVECQQHLPFPRFDAGRLRQHDRGDFFGVQQPVPAGSLQLLRLRKRGRAAHAVDVVEEFRLLLRGEVGKFDGGIELEFSCIDKGLQRRDEVVEADIPLDLSCAFGKIFSNRLIRSELRANLARS